MIRRPRTAFFAILTLLVLALAAPAAAQIPCEDDPYGELPDCSFEQDPLADWTLVTGSFFGPTLGDVDDPHRTGSGSAEVHAVEAGPNFYTSILASQCFAVTPAWQSNYGAWMRVLESFQPVGCYVERFAYEDSGCSNLLGSSAASHVNPHAGGWTESAGTGELAGEFARLEINCSSQDAFEIQVDDAFSVRPKSCSDEPNNVLPNCGFEEGDPPSGWMLLEGTSFGQSTEPALIGSGSGVVVSEYDFDDQVVVKSPCYAFSAAGADATFGASFRIQDGLAAHCRTYLSWYEAPDCSGSVDHESSPPVAPDENGWVQSSGVASKETALSAALQVFCLGLRPFTVQIDEAFILVEPPIFGDGFESGDTTSWQ